MGETKLFDKRIRYLGDFTWKSVSGGSVWLQPVPIQSLSELERGRLRDVALNRLQQDYDLGCQLTMPKDGEKRKKSLRRKFDSLAKDKNKDKEWVPQAFGLPLWHVITNDRRQKRRGEGQRGEGQRGERRDSPDLVSSILHFTSRRSNKELSSSTSSLSSASETPNGSTSPGTPEAAPRARRRGGMSVDCITDLDDGQSRLLEALQLSLPADTPSKKEKQCDKKLSLNPIYPQVPRLVDCCCQHLEKHGLQTVGIFRVGSSKKRVKQLRDEFDQAEEVALDEEHGVHDVAALLKEFLRDMPDPLLTRELYPAFINCMSLDPAEQHNALQLLVALLPPCHSDTLRRLLEFLSTVAVHAEDARGTDGQEVTGNKMTSLNLATIFGPNLLHLLKSSDKEFSVKASAQAEDSSAIIGVVQRMIDNYEALFTVPADLQNEVLLSVLETDPDVVDHLLRRKAAQWECPSSPRREDSLSLSERCSSSDSVRASSGDISPYENNSPVVQFDWLQPPGQGDNQPIHRPEWLTPGGLAKPRTGLPPAGSAEKLSTLKGSSSEAPQDLHGNEKKPVRCLQTLPDVVELKSHPQLTRTGSNMTSDSWQNQPQHSMEPSPWKLQCSAGYCKLEKPTLAPASPAKPYNSPRPIKSQDGKPPPPYPGLTRGTATSTPPPGSPASRRPQGPGPFTPSSPGEAQGPGAQDWQRDKWKIWQLLSSENADTLPETLV